jgi:hypothetical protein
MVGDCAVECWRCQLVLSFGGSTCVTPPPTQFAAGELPPDTPPDFGAVVDRANSAAQNELAALVPGAVHITDTHSGHNIMIDNAPIVIQAIRMVVDAVKAGQASLKG